jgi:hypothetical protein
MDKIDRDVLTSLSNGPKKGAELAREVFGAKKTVDIRKYSAILRYRLRTMMAGGFVKKDNITKSYSLKNCTVGYGVLEIKDNITGEERLLEMGRIILIEHALGTTPIFLEMIEND